MAGVPVIGATTLAANAVPNTQLDARTQQAMIDAINDEYHAHAFYTAVIEKFGPVRPFTNIVRAEERHAQLWNRLFARYGLSVPEDTFAGNVEAPDTLEAACQMGVEAEIANVQMYDNFLSFVQEPDLRAAFIRLRTVSQNHHKPAFERCASRMGRQRSGRGLGRMR
jgi:rubrerythrin